jgi:hypothetical protein
MSWAIQKGVPLMQVVNGFVCQNCTDVDYAKKGIDPAHPQQGPASAQSPKDDAKKAGTVTSNAVTFGGSLSRLNDVQGKPGADDQSGRQDKDGDSAPKPGQTVDIAA